MIDDVLVDFPLGSTDNKSPRSKGHSAEAIHADKFAGSVHTTQIVSEVEVGHPGGQACSPPQRREVQPVRLVRIRVYPLLPAR